YRVRFGETLQTVALLDPYLRDAQLWKLLAHLNGLSQAVDDSGAPVSVPACGQYLVLPTKEDVEEFKLLHTLAIQVARSAPAAPDAVQPPGDCETRFESGAVVRSSELSDGVRILIIEPDPREPIVSIRLQASFKGEWLTIASYDHANGSAVRNTYSE